MSRERLRRRRLRRIARAARGTWCESQMWSGPYYGARCIFPATGYQRQNDIYVCGVHARAYLNVDRSPWTPAGHAPLGLAP